MIKQSEQKEKQGFRKGCPCCENCAYFISETIREKSFMGHFYNKEINLRCTLGGFDIKKRSWCREHQFKEKGEE